MRKLCPNLEREDALDTVLEIPLPEEMFPNEKGGGGGGKGGSSSTGQDIHYAWLKSQAFDKATNAAPPKLSGRTAELQLLLNVAGSPLIPMPVPFDVAFNNRSVRESSIGLDPRSTANLFIDAVCIGEKIINGEECFILKLEASAQVLKSRSASSFDIIRHTVWGYFSQRTGLLMQLEDSHLLRMKAGRGRPCISSKISCNSINNDSSIFWETSMESIIDDYRYIDGINIAHSGRTIVTLFRYGEGSINHKRRLEELWTIEDADFNLHGLAMDFFLPPTDLKVDWD